MDATYRADDAVAAIAAAIGEPARVRMLYSLMDNCARTGTELAAVAEVTPSTASVHLNRLRTQGLVRMQAQGKHRYYSLGGPHVAKALEKLSVLAGESGKKFRPTTPPRLRAARTCYDHIAGTLGVAIHDRMSGLGWLNARYELTSEGDQALESLGAEVDAARSSRRRFAYPCLDWSERQSHIGGALGAAILNLAVKRRWVTPDLDSRALEITRLGRREMQARLGVRI